MSAQGDGEEAEDAARATTTHRREKQTPRGSALDMAAKEGGGRRVCSMND